MALPSTQNLNKGVDLTGIANVNAGDENNLVDLATLVAGHGLILNTVDTALNTPEVPDPDASASHTQWKEFLWKRVLFDDSGYKVYSWNDNLVADATYLKWQEQVFPTVDIEADIAAIDARLTNAEGDIVTTTDIANNALANAAIADGKAVTATNTANTAQTTANTAQETAEQALETANAASTAAAAKGPIETTLSAGPIEYQEMRTNQARTAVEWFSRKNTYAKYTEQFPNGDSGGAGADGLNTRLFNTEVVDLGGIASVDGGTGKVTLAKTGVYYVKAYAVCYATNTLSSQLLIVKDADSSTLLTGLSIRDGANGTTVVSPVEGLVVATADNFVIRADHYIDFDGASAYGLGYPTGAAMGLSGVEIYAVLEIWFLGA